MPLSVFLRIMLSRIVKNQKTNKPI
jgi:hypothetical protein